MRSLQPFIYILIIFIFNSCFKEDERVDPYPGSIVAIQDSVQKHQSYFDFETGRIAGTHNNNEWEIGFESSQTGWHIITNSGNSWFLYNTRVNSAENLPDLPVQLQGMYDVPSAWPDSTAAGNWVSFNNGIKAYTGNIYILAKYSGGNFIERKHLVFLNVTDSSYTFRYKDYQGNSDTVVIQKDTTVNFIYYSFRRLDQTNLEPDKNSYDLVFTSYYDIATNFNITMPYLVGGGFMNTWKTLGILDSINRYEHITIQTAGISELTAKRDIPGYRWKLVTVDVTGGGAATYEVKTNYSYIFKTQEGQYYKMRFLSYSIDGRSGYPQFEYELLE